MFGTTICRIGNAPKRLLVYRADMPFGKLQTPEFILPDGSVARVEWLAAGQQFVAFGIHPVTRKPYEWIDGSPLDVPAGDLPVVTEAAVREFLEKAERLLRAAGAKPKSEHVEHERAGAKLAGVGPNECPSTETVEEALDYVPNSDLSYDDWIKVGFALYHALGAAGLGIWMAWSARSAKNDPVVSEAKWASFATGRSVTVGTLFWLASQNGWRRKNGPVRRDSHAADPADNRASNRPLIRIEAGAISRAVDEAEAALIEAGAHIYQRGGIIVCPANAAVAISRRANSKSTTRIVPVNGLHIAELMGEVARWEKFDGRKEDWTATDCPQRVADFYQSRPQWNLRVLAGVIDHPTLRPDGSVLDEAGYDVATGLLYDPKGASFPQVPDAPDRAAAEAALDILLTLLKEFPFVTPADRAVALSAILTSLVRRSLDTAPLHAFTAPTAGSGKSMLVDICALIVTGETAPVTSLGLTEEESEKRLGSSLLGGDPYVTLDNIVRMLSGAFLCQILTQKTVKIRVLGQSANVVAPTSACVFATGNNLVIEGDMTRRAVVCSLDANVEEPENRVFEVNPLAMISADRGAYVLAGLTILRAYHVAGRPETAKPLGSFEDWSHLVRNALIWIGEADPCLTMEKARATDPKRESLTAIVQQWARVIGVRRVTAKEIIAAANGPVADLGYDGRTSPETEDFREALLGVAGEGSAISGRRLGKWLGSNKGRVVAEMKIVADGSRAGVALWRLETGAPF